MMSYKLFMDMRWFSRLLSLIALFFSVAVSAADNQVLLEFGGIRQTSELRLSIGKSQIIYSKAPLDQVVIGNPAIADIKLLSSRQVLILGSKPGHTNLVFRDKDRSLIALMDVVVGYDLEGIKRKLYEVMPHEDMIEVRGANDAVMLSGQISNALAVDTAISIASSYVPKDKVINLLEVGGGHQVMLEVKVAEVSRKNLREFGIGLSASDTGTSGLRSFSFNTGNAGTNATVANPFADVTISDLTGSIAENMLLRLQMLETKGLAKTLAEPNLVALSGQEGSFLAGGEFPYVTTSGIGTSNTDFKEYGVGLKFTPTVLSNQKINLKLNTEVSLIDTAVIANGVGSAATPPISTRRTATTIEMADGQSFAISGLLQSDIQNVIDQLPGLGDIPVLGALFRSSNFQRQETELVVIVTPRLVKPVAGGQLAAPTDNFVPPSWLDQYLLGNLEGSPKRVKRSDRAKQSDSEKTSSGVEGQYGHQVYDKRADAKSVNGVPSNVQ